jgi:tRNA(fMet)-specific endonuclease VapC
VNYLLDTHVISEFTRAKPAPTVIAWLQAHERDDLFLSVITIGEIRQGITRLPPSAKREGLTSWLNDTLLPAYAERLLPIDSETMLQWGSLTGRLLNEGRRMPVMDALLAATAVQYDLPLVTRNVRDFSTAGVELVNPWE